jgi:hypothetical protein
VVPVASQIWPNIGQENRFIAYGANHVQEVHHYEVRDHFRTVGRIMGLINGDDPRAPEELPASITSNFTLGGGFVYHSNGITISNNAVLTINAGAEIIMEPNKRITIESGSKIVAIGTEADPIVFKRSGGSRWDRILLRGDNNVFENCTFDGGRYNVDIRSANNSFSDCTFKNAERGIFAYRQANGKRSSFSLEYCTIINNYHGITAYYSNGGIENSTIRNNSRYGLYLYQAMVGHPSGGGGLFLHNAVTDNGHSGIYLTPMVNFIMALMLVITRVVIISSITVPAKYP